MSNFSVLTRSASPARPSSLLRRSAGLLLAGAATAGLLMNGAPAAQAATPAATTTMYASNCPANIKQGEVNGCVTRLQTLLNSKAHAGLAVDGVFGNATAAAVRTWQSGHGLVRDGIVGVQTKASLGDHRPATSAVGGSISRAEVLSRSLNWIYARTPYNRAVYFPDAQGRGYREDCSGFVSMSWHLSSSLSTRTLPSVGTAIAKSSLQPGDILDYYNVHTVLFVGWGNSAHTTVDIREESNPSTPTAQRNNVPLSNYGAFTAYRYVKIH